jgi:hypothetical protein
VVVVAGGAADAGGLGGGGVDGGPECGGVEVAVVHVDVLVLLCRSRRGMELVGVGGFEFGKERKGMVGIGTNQSFGWAYIFSPYKPVNETSSP